MDNLLDYMMYKNIIMNIFLNLETSLMVIMLKKQYYFLKYELMNLKIILFHFFYVSQMH